MYFYIQYGLILSWITLGSATFSLRRPGWLDKMVAYHKNRLFEDFRKLPAVKIKATLEAAPPGYVDSTEWDYVSVIRLLSLIRESEVAQPVRRALQNVLGGRRMNFQESLKAFPSLSKDSYNYFYYDIDSGENYTDATIQDSCGDRVTEKSYIYEDVIVVSNPVEARLPSAMISIKLMREILESRAKAARYMPTTHRTIPWITIKRKTTEASAQNNATKDGNKTIT